MSVKEKDSKRLWADTDDAPELDEEFFAKARKLVGNKEVSDSEFRAAVRARGRPRKANPKIPVHIRFSPEVVAYFRSTGKGWQTRMDEALKEWIAEHGG